MNLITINKFISKIPKTKELLIETQSEIFIKFKNGASAWELAKIYKNSRKFVYNLIKNKKIVKTIF